MKASDKFMHSMGANCWIELTGHGRLQVKYQAACCHSHRHIFPTPVELWLGNPLDFPYTRFFRFVGFSVCYPKISLDFCFIGLLAKARRHRPSPHLLPADAAQLLLHWVPSRPSPNIEI